MQILLNIMRLSGKERSVLPGDSSCGNDRFPPECWPSPVLDEEMAHERRVWAGLRPPGSDICSGPAEFTHDLLLHL